MLELATRLEVARLVDVESVTSCGRGVTSGRPWVYGQADINQKEHAMAPRKPQPSAVEIPPLVATALSAARAALESARDETERSIDQMDRAAVKAYEKQVPISTIATELGVTRKTVYTALTRMGAFAE